MEVNLTNSIHGNYSGKFYGVEVTPTENPSYFIPKGQSLNPYTQDDISRMMDNINSYCRESLGNKCPYDMFAFLYGEDILNSLGVNRVAPNDVTMNRSIFQEEVPNIKTAQSWKQMQTATLLYGEAVSIIIWPVY